MTKKILTCVLLKFEKDIENVCERIGASRENISHNQCNQKLMKGCE